MINRSNRFWILTIGTIILPVIIYAVFSVSKLKENEKVIEQIYKEQLDAIIFSINQYSTDVLTSLLEEINVSINSNKKEVSDFESIVSYSGLDGLYLKPLTLDSSFKVLFETEGVKQSRLNLDSIFEVNAKLIDQLDGYMSAGYRKVEPITSGRQIQHQLFYAILKNSQNESLLLAGLIDPRKYIPEILSPKLQQISNEELIVVFSNASDNRILYCTDSLNHEVSLFGKTWLFSDIKVGLSARNATVGDLVEERLTSNLIASGLLIFLLVTGITIIIYNVKKEEKLAQNKSNFVSNVSHELRTPLALISMFAETLSLKRVTSEEQKEEYIDIIFRETSRLTSMVNRILNFSRIEANERKYQFAPFELKELIETLIGDYSYHLKQEGFEYQIHLPEERVEIVGDKEAIYEAIVNLLDNAVKYSSERKEITIKLAHQKDQTSVEVSDLGKGIPSDKYHDIFEKFYRVTDGDLYTVKGTGLGLSIVKHIMDAHHGKIEVTSELSQGSTFKLTFIQNHHA